MAWSAAVLNHLSLRQGRNPHWLLYVEAKNPNESANPIGVWSGNYNTSFTIDGSSRSYSASSEGMRVDDIVFEKGTVIRRQNIELSGVTQTALNALRNRTIRGQKAELHLAFFDPMTEVMIGYNRVFKGFVNKAPASIGKKGQASTIQIELTSRFRTLTKPLPLKKSERAQLARAGDPFRQYGSNSAEVKVEWGPGNAP